MAKKFAFVGAPGSGKSTLVADVFKTLKQTGLNVEMVPELVRYDIAKNGPMKSIWEQYRTLQHQRELEDAVPNTFDFVIVDCSTLLSYFYAVFYADHTDARQRLVMQDMYTYLTNDIYLKRYDQVFYLARPNDSSKVKLKDGVRFQSEIDVVNLDAHMNMVFTKLHNPGNIHHITGAFNTRLDQVMNIIAEK